MMMMMAEEAVAVLKEIPDDQNIKRENNNQQRRMRGMRRVGRTAAHQFEDLNGNEKRRFPNRQVAGPAYAEHQTDALHQREQTVKERARCGPEHLRFGQLANLI